MASSTGIFTVFCLPLFSVYMVSHILFFTSNIHEIRANFPQGETERELRERLANYYDPNEAFYQFPPFADQTGLVMEEPNLFNARNCRNRATQNSHGNTCPGYYNNNTNYNRIPTVISEFKCSCQKCQLPRNSLPFFTRNRYLCKPVYRLQQTLHLDREEWRLVLEPIAVGCRCEDYTPMSALVL